MQIRTYRDSDHDDVVSLWKVVFPDAPARNDPVHDIARKLKTQPELFLVAVDAEGVGGQGGDVRQWVGGGQGEVGAGGQLEIA